MNRPLSDLLGREVSILPSELVEYPILAVIRLFEDNSNKLFVELLKAVNLNAHTYTFAVLEPRLERDELSGLLRGNALLCAVTLVPEDRHDPASPFNLSWWRGGAATIADVILCS